MSTYNFEDVDVPRGAYISWGNHIGQHVTGKVLDYQPAGGTDFDGNPCPQLSVELVEPAASFNKSRERTDFPAGELVVLNCGQASLKRAIRAADPSAGDVIKITLSEFAKSAKGDVKVFAIKIARGAAPEARGANTQPAQQGNPFQQQIASAPAANPFSTPVQAAQTNPFASTSVQTDAPPF